MASTDPLPATSQVRQSSFRRSQPARFSVRARDIPNDSAPGGGVGGEHEEGRVFGDVPPRGSLKEHGYRSLLQFVVCNGSPEDRELVHQLRVAASKLVANLTELESKDIVALPEPQFLALINAHHFAASRQRLDTSIERVVVKSNEYDPDSPISNWTTLFPIDTERERLKLQQGFREATNARLVVSAVDRPSPGKSPRMVVETLLKALARIDIPSYNNGLKVMRNFMHPGSTLHRFQDNDELREKIETTRYRSLLNNRDFMWHKTPLSQRNGEILELKTKVLEREAREWVEFEWVLEVLNGVWYLRQVRTRIR